ncbi:hypothetical protein ACL03H_00750 [Saccharopolyspora sp. MS10]|uniref:hypothetical protein n=1 Tax=Saccharopolyspora sp. MS10 TaxID=3385973 RepID=UPI0039A0D9B9
MFPVDDRPTRPIPRVPRRRSSDQRFLLFAGVGGMLLIAAPIVVFSQTTPQDGAPGAPGSEAGRVPAQVSDPPQHPRPLAESGLPGGAAHLDRNGRVGVLARGLDDVVVRNVTDEGRSLSGGWTNMGGNAVDAPTAVRDGYGDLAGFAIGVDGHLRGHLGIAKPGSQQVPWRDMGGDDLTGVPAAAVNSENRIVVVARSLRGALRVTEQRELGVDEWTPWQDLPIEAVEGDPAIHRDARGDLRVFAQGADRRLRAVAQLRPAADAWGAPEDLGLGGEGRPSVALDKQGRLRVFVRTPQETLQQIAETGTASHAWGEWVQLGGTIESEPFAAVDAKGAVACYALDQRGELQEIYQAGPGRSGWSRWIETEGVMNELVGVSPDARGRLFVFAVGERGGMESMHQTIPAGGPWTSWSTELGGSFTLNR